MRVYLPKNIAYGLCNGRAGWCCSFATAKSVKSSGLIASNLDYHRGFGGVSSALSKSSHVIRQSRRPDAHMIARSFSSVDGVQSMPSKSEYNRRVRTAVAHKDIEASLDAIKLARQHYDVPIWADTYNEVLYLLCQRHSTKSLSTAVTLLSEMTMEKRCNSRSFNTVIAGCSRQQDLKTAEYVQKLMVQAGKRRGAFTFANLINCCSKDRGDVQTAEKFWKEMIGSNVRPSLVAANCLLRVYSRDAGRSHKAVYLFHDMQTKYKLKPDADTMTNLAFALLADRKVGDAVKYLTKAYHDNIVCKGYVYNSVLDVCRLEKDWDLVASIREVCDGTLASWRPGDGHTYRKLCTLCDERDATIEPVAYDVKSLRPTASRSHYRKDDLNGRSNQTRRRLRKSLDRLMKAAASATSWEEIATHIDSIDQWNEMLTQASLVELERLVDLPGAFDHIQEDIIKSLGQHFILVAARTPVRVKALDVFMTLAQQRLADRNMVERLYDGCAKAGDVRTSLSLYEFQRDVASDPQLRIQASDYNTILRSCANAGDPVTAEAVYEEIREAVGCDQHILRNVLEAYVNAMSSDVIIPDEMEIAECAVDFYQQATQTADVVPDTAIHFLLFRALLSDAEGIVDVDQLMLPPRFFPFILEICRTAPTSQLDTGVFNAGIDYLQRFGQVDAAFQLYNIMTQRQIPPDDGTLTLLFAACSRGNQASVGLSFLDHLMQDEEYTPSVKVLNGAIELCATSGEPLRALELFDGVFMSDRTVPDALTYENVIHAFARVGDVVNSMELLEMMATELGATVGAYNRVLQACGKARNEAQAMDLLDRMQKEGLTPDVVTYNMVLKSFVTTRYHGSLLLEDSEEQVEVEVKDVSSRTHDVKETMRKLLDSMDANDVEPSAATYSRMLIACIQRSSYDTALDLFDRFTSNLRTVSRETASELVSPSLLHAYISACKRQESSERILHLISLLRQWHRQLGVATPSAVMLKVLDELDDWKEAVSILKDLHDGFGTSPDAAFVDRVMTLCNEAEAYQSALQVFYSMQKAAEYQVRPTVDVYVQAIYAAEERVDWDEALRLFMEMKKVFGDEISSTQLQRIALGRYSLGRQSAS